MFYNKIYHLICVKILSTKKPLYLDKKLLNINIFPLECLFKNFRKLSSTRMACGYAPKAVTVERWFSRYTELVQQMRNYLKRKYRFSAKARACVKITEFRSFGLKLHIKLCISMKIFYTFVNANTYTHKHIRSKHECLPSGSETRVTSSGC